MRPPGRPKAECRSAKHEGFVIHRTFARACARANACEWAERLATRVLQA